MRSAFCSATLAVLALASVAAAASLGGVGSSALGAGDGPIAVCDPDGFTVAYTTSAGNVTAVTVGGIADPGCEGGALSVTVTDAGGTGIASGGPQTIPIDGDAVDDSVAVPVSPQPLAENPSAVEIAIAGP
ncbi:MAG: hypothetical protein ACR2GT_13275 [Gaiellaceae bacterium]